MPGFANSPTGESIMWADNVDFSGAVIPTTTVTTNGQLLIGSTAAPHLKVGNLTSTSGTLIITNGSGTINLEVGGGTTTVQTLTPNSGGAVSPVTGDIDVVGIAYGSGSTFPLFSRNGGAGVFQIADKSFYTPYVVDPSGTTFGQGGTYGSISAAITQMVIDNLNINTILVRPGFLSESVAIPNNLSVNIIGICQVQGTGAGPSVLVGGNLTIGTGCLVRIANMSWLAPSGDTVTNANNSSLYVYNSNLAVQSGQAFTTSTTGSGTNSFYNCQIGPATVGGTATLKAFNCEWGSPNNIILQNSGIFEAYDSTLYAVSLANAAIHRFFRCNWINGGALTNNITGSSSNTQLLYYNNFYDGSPSNNVNATATYNAFGNTTGGKTAQLFTSSVTLVVPAGQMGNIYSVRSVAGDVTINIYDQFVAISTAAARAISMPSTPFVGETHTLSDITGSAATNNITITGAAGNIDGAATYVINVNYGSVDLVWTGTIWKVK